MNKESIAIFFRLVFFTVILVVLNYLFYQMPDLKDEMKGFIYQLPIMYAFFLVLSIAIMAILVIVSKKNKEQIGFAFLLLTGIKMGLCYVFARPIINKIGENPTEKINFFVIFILFLAIEAYFTARLLNNKQ